MKRVIMIVLVLIVACCGTIVICGRIERDDQVFEKNRASDNQGWCSLHDCEMDASVILSYLRTKEFFDQNREVLVYEDVVKAYEKEYGSLKYGLVYVTEDDVPELLVNLQDYWISLYTSVDGNLYAIMEQAAYGTWGRTYTYREKEGLINSYVYSFEEGIQVNHEECYRINEDYKLEELVPGELL